MSTGRITTKYSVPDKIIDNHNTRVRLITAGASVTVADGAQTLD